MADEKSPQNPRAEQTGEADAVVEAIEPESEAEDAAANTAEEETPTMESLSASLSEAQARIAELQDQALRAKAEVENTRRRSARDVEHAHKYGLERVTGELLPVLDSLEKAVASAVESAAAVASTAAPEGAAEGTRAIAEGVGLSLKMFLTALTKVGIEQIDPLGEPFDPQFHEAIAMLENPDAEPNSVMEVVQRGYSLNGRLVRAAKVIVVKGSGEERQSTLDESA